MFLLASSTTRNPSQTTPSGLQGDSLPASLSKPRVRSIAPHQLLPRIQLPYASTVHATTGCFGWVTTPRPATMSRSWILIRSPSGNGTTPPPGGYTVSESYTPARSFLCTMPCIQSLCLWMSALQLSLPPPQGAKSGGSSSLAFSSRLILLEDSLHHCYCFR